MAPLPYTPPLNRFPMRYGPENYQSFSMSMPLSSHWKKVSCEEFECDDYINGFVLTVDVRDKLGQRQYDYVTHDRTRTYSMQRVDLYTFKFVYPPGTPGFAGTRHDHMLPVGREPLWRVRGGDWRGNPLGIPTTQHKRAEHWIEHFALNQIAILEAQQRG